MDWLVGGLVFFVVFVMNLIVIVSLDVVKVVIVVFNVNFDVNMLLKEFVGIYGFFSLS